MWGTKAKVDVARPWKERAYAPRPGVTHYTCHWCGSGFLARRDIEEHQEAHHEAEVARFYGGSTRDTREE